MCVCTCGLIPALVESVYLDSVVSVFLQDLLSVFIRIERVHEHQWNISIICFIQVLQRPKRKKYLIKKHYQAMITMPTMPTMFLINTDTLAGLLHSAAHLVLSGRMNSR